MSLEQHVTSLELSQRLKALGVPQESAYYWKKRYRMDEWTLTYVDNAKSGDPTCSAFLASELGEMLPDFFGVAHSGQVWYCVPNEFANCDCPQDYDNGCSTEATTMAETIGLMLIHLIEQKIVDPQTL